MGKDVQNDVDEPRQKGRYERESDHGHYHADVSLVELRRAHLFSFLGGLAALPAVVQLASHSLEIRLKTSEAVPRKRLRAQVSAMR